MDEPEQDHRASGDFEGRIRSRVRRKIVARHKGEHSVWFGLGMFGLVGWSVAIPTIVGIALGIYLDEHHPVDFSWTLSLLAVGVVVGCLNAWYWIQQERQRDERDERDEDE